MVAGSDDGSFFIWDTKTTNIVRVLRGDDSIVNCLQPHPTYCMLATSGIDPVVRLWTPQPQVTPTVSSPTPPTACWRPAACCASLDPTATGNTNCLQPHPTYCILATSGIDPVVRLWTPQPQVTPTVSSPTPPTACWRPAASTPLCVSGPHSHR